MAMASRSFGQACWLLICILLTSHISFSFAGAEDDATIIQPQRKSLLRSEPRGPKLSEREARLDDDKVATVVEPDGSLMDIESLGSSAAELAPSAPGADEAGPGPHPEDSEEAMLEDDSHEDGSDDPLDETIQQPSEEELEAQNSDLIEASESTDDDMNMTEGYFEEEDSEPMDDSMLDEETWAEEVDRYGDKISEPEPIMTEELESDPEDELRSSLQNDLNISEMALTMETSKDHDHYDENETSPEDLHKVLFSQEEHAADMEENDDGDDFDSAKADAAADAEIDTGYTGSALSGATESKAAGKNSEEASESPEVELIEDAKEDAQRAQEDDLDKICGFASWNEWTACSKSCGVGRRVRSRQASGLFVQYFYYDDHSKIPIDLVGHQADISQSDLEVNVASAATNVAEAASALAGVQKSAHFGARWTGKLLVEKAGHYDFTIASPAGCKLKVGAALKLDHRRSDDSTKSSEKTGRVWLAKGTHSIDLQIFSRHGASGLSEQLAFRYQGPDSQDKDVAVPASVLRHQPTQRECQGSALQAEICKEARCPVDCLWSDWSLWSECSSKCGGGLMERSRSVARMAERGGLGCSLLEGGEGEGAIQRKACNEQACQ
eukprot:TRINITY_DN4178_c1_g3_i1.p1 TRINITY_DN4178_c1_g3~~TRINITY_DN4178_c1_g3_i1.p1  ORF type:complete len:612 (+),score=182.83 TRINITY_DN4178_c1_g3_i1:92-1927(+)